DELHREVPLTAGRVQLVQRDEVRVDDVGERAKLSLEAIQIAARGLTEQLERDLALQLPIERAIHHPGAPDPQGTAHLEPATSKHRRRMDDVHRDLHDIIAIARTPGGSEHSARSSMCTFGSARVEPRFR